MTDIRPADIESSDSELSEEWDIVAQADVCAADVSSDGESVEVLEHEEADCSHPEDGNIAQSEISNKAPSVVDRDLFEEVPSLPTEETTVEGDHSSSDVDTFSSELRKRRQHWLQRAADRPIIMKTISGYDRHYGQFNRCCVTHGLYVRTLCVCAVAIVFGLLALCWAMTVSDLPSRRESNHVDKAKDVVAAPDSIQEVYQCENNKREQIQHVDGQQKMDTVLEEQFKKILAQLESNQKNPFPGLHEGNSEVFEGKESHLLNSENFFLNRISDGNAEETMYKKDLRVESSSDNTENCDPQDNRKFRYQNTLNFNYDELGSTFKFLSSLTSSDISKFQFGQSVMMLNTLNNNLKQLESLVSNSFDDELNFKIKKQRHRLTNLLIKVIKYGISKTVDKLAWNIYDKVKKVERSIQGQWCKFENKIVALDGNIDIPFERCGNRNNNNNGETKKGRVKRTWSESLNLKNEYQVDKDSVGKDYNKHSVNEGDDYKNIVKSKGHVENTKYDTGSDIDEHVNKKTKTYNSSVDKKQLKKELNKQQNKKAKRKHKKLNRKNHKDNKNSGDVQAEKPSDQFIKQNGIDLSHWRSIMASDRIAENKYVFDRVKSEHTCSHNGKIVECTTNFVKETGENPAGHQDSKIKYEVVRECDGSELTGGNCKQIVIDFEKNNAKMEKIPLDFDKTIKSIQQWSFVIDESKVGNSSAVSGDWFIKSGQARSKIRSSNHKSDWLFERAKGRQTTRHDYYSSAMWFFRRAYARHQCRLSPNLPWCQWQKHTIKTFPTNSYFR